jgi:SAM-dependent methyltransferase
MTTCVLAAANPDSHFFAADFMPAHIVQARRLAEEARLDNVTFYDDSFAELLQRDLPDFDFIALHGVLSWVSPAIRQDIVRLIRARLKPGGAVYVSYNALPGWAAASPIRWLLRTQTAAGVGSMEQRLSQALEFIGKMEQAGAGYFRANPRLTEQLDKIKKQDHKYLIHEYLNDYWQPFYFPEVADLMSEAKLAFGASATLAENIDSMRIRPDLRELFGNVVDPLVSETLRDFAINQRFRRDIYVRGRISLGRAELRQEHERTVFGLVMERSECNLETRVPIGKLQLVPETHGLVLDVLADGPSTIAGLKADRRLSRMSAVEVLNLLIVLCAVGYVRAGRPGCAHDRAASTTAAFNAAIIRRALRGQPLSWLASPVLGGSIKVSMLGQLLLAAESGSAPDAIDAICRGLAGTEVSPSVDGKPLTGQELAEHLRKMQPEFRTAALPRLKALGAA